MKSSSRGGGEGGRACAALAGLLTLLGALATSPVGAVDLSGTARIAGGPTSVDGVSSGRLDQRYQLNLSQALTPFLGVLFSYRFNDFSSSLVSGDDFRRRLRSPSLDLVYNRPTVSARLSLQDRSISSTAASQNVDSRLYLGQIDWQPHRGPRFSLRFQDSSNVVDEALFGRDTDSRFLDFTTFYDRRTWSTRYTFRRSVVSNNLSGLSLEENRHEVRATWGDQFWGDKLRLSADGLVTRVEQSRLTQGDGTLANPIVPRQGLFAVDLSPEIGELAAAPGLIDGDLETPAATEAEVGGANTFRNLGVDLGITRPATQLEITVDGPSSAELGWQVYVSQDNLDWQSVAGVSPSFDLALLRYELVFPEVSARYFKAVNTTVNAFPRVSVTELRALVQAASPASGKDNARTFRGNVSAAFNPTARLGFNLLVGARNDETLAGGLISRKIDESYYDAQMRVGLTHDLQFRLGYRFVDLTDRLGSIAARQEEAASANLEWNPLPAASVLFTATQRDESEEGRRILSSSSVGVRALTDLLPGLRLISELARSELDDPVSEFQQTAWIFSEGFDTQPTARWNLAGRVSLASYDSNGRQSVRRRDSYELRTTWRATATIALRGDWTWATGDREDSLRQAYGVSWSPSTRLGLSLAYTETSSGSVRSTSNTSGTFSYRLNRSARMFASATRSSFVEVGTSRDISSLQAGLDIVF